MPRRRSTKRLAPSPSPSKSTPTPRWPIAVAVLSLLTSIGTGIAYLEKLTNDCKAESSKIIDQQEKLQSEILSRRQAFVQTAMHATSVAELREFLSHHDSLHGYVLKEFSGRSLADLENEERRNGKHMDEPSFFAIDLAVNFSETRIDAFADDMPEHRKQNTLRALDALQFQDASTLQDSDIVEVNRIAGIEWRWLFNEHLGAMKRGRMVEACSSWITLRDMFDDVFYLNRPAVHGVYEKQFPEQPEAK